MATILALTMSTLLVASGAGTAIIRNVATKPANDDGMAYRQVLSALPRC